ncbi:MAG: hypothetical protein Tp156SUR915002_21 [Prokaryotic dsDNA virus sp.]|jgi:hypothetical protein|nr:MAG: hypothetical protein Tp162SUR384061_30 [Prokaryotic dsDNA virus sp.]QDP59760.1 MAG: hypothetical protein Tp156SUR915002_21 [Prokaryotic dsDNA virus sp.]|tara:strand:+ start:19790 stop:20056 length:267 start_codon:yes stop_codon:yes gene_type:complete
MTFIKEPKITTDEGKVLAILKDNEWVCGTHFQQGNNRFQAFIPTYAQRVSDLKKRGYDIEKANCNKHNHKGNVAMYRIKIVIKQMELL